MEVKNGIEVHSGSEQLKWKYTVEVNNKMEVHYGNEQWNKKRWNGIE